MEGVDWVKVVELLGEGEKCSSLIKEPRPVLLMFGFTGSGKTTTLLHLSGKKMQVGLSPTELVLAETPTGDEIGTMSSSGKSETRFINAQLHGDWVFADSAGISDTEGPTAELANILSVANVIQNCSRLVPAIVVEFSLFESLRGQTLRQLFEYISQFFPNCSELSKALVVFVTKAGSDYQLCHVSRFLSKIITSDTAANTPEFLQIANIIAEDLSVPEHCQCVTFIRPVRDDVKGTLRFLDQRKPLENPKEYFQLSLPSQLEAEIDNSLLHILSNVRSWLKEGKDMPLLTYLHSFKILKDRISKVDAAYNEMSEIIRDSLLKEQMDVTSRLYKLVEVLEYRNSEDIETFNKFIGKLTQLSSLKEWFSPELHTPERLLKSACDLLQKQLESLNSASGFPLMRQIIEKLKDTLTLLDIRIEDKNQLYAEALTIVRTKVERIEQDLKSTCLPGDCPNSSIESITQGLQELKDASATFSDLFSDNYLEKSFQNSVDHLLLRLEGILKESENTINELTSDTNIAQLLLTSDKDYSLVRLKMKLLKHLTHCSSLGVLVQRNLGEPWLQIRQQCFEHLNKIICLINEGAGTTDKLTEFQDMFEKMGILAKLDEEFNTEVQQRIRPTISQIDLVVRNNLAKIEQEMKDSKPNYEVIHQIITDLQRCSWLDGYSPTYRISTRIDQAVQFIVHKLQTLTKRIDILWNSDSQSICEIVLNVSEMEPLKGVSEAISHNIEKCLHVARQKALAVFSGSESQEFSFLDADKKFRELQKVQKISRVLQLENEHEQACLDTLTRVQKQIDNICGQLNLSQNLNCAAALDEIKRISHLKHIPESIWRSAYESSVQTVTFEIHQLKSDILELLDDQRVGEARKKMEHLESARSLFRHIPNIEASILDARSRFKEFKKDLVKDIPDLLENDTAHLSKLFSELESSALIEPRKVLRFEMNKKYATLRKNVNLFNPGELGINEILTFQEIYSVMVQFHDILRDLKDHINESALQLQIRGIRDIVQNKLQSAIATNRERLGDRNFVDASKVHQILLSIVEHDSSNLFEFDNIRKELLSFDHQYQETSKFSHETLDQSTAIDLSHYYAGLSRMGKKNLPGQVRKLEQLRGSVELMIANACQNISNLPISEQVSKLEDLNETISYLPAQFKQYADSRLQKIRTNIERESQSFECNLSTALRENAVGTLVKQLELVKNDSERTQKYTFIIIEHFKALVKQYQEAIKADAPIHALELILVLDNYIAKLSFFDPSLVESVQKSWDDYVQTITNRIFDFTHNGNDNVLSGASTEQIVDSIQGLLAFVKNQKAECEIARAALSPVESQFSKIEQMLVVGMQQYDFKSIASALKALRHSQPLFQVLTKSDIHPDLVELKTAMNRVKSYDVVLKEIHKYLESLPELIGAQWDAKEYDKVAKALTAALSKQLIELDIFIPGASNREAEVHQKISMLYNGVVNEAKTAWNILELEKFNSVLAILGQLGQVASVLREQGLESIFTCFDEKIQDIIKTTDYESVDSLARTIIELREISLVIPVAKNVVKQALSQVLDKAPKEGFSTLAIKLEMNPNGKLILEEYPHFAEHQRNIWIKKTETQNFAYALENFKINDTKPESLGAKAIKFFSKLVPLPDFTIKNLELSYEVFNRYFKFAIDGFIRTQDFRTIVNATKQVVTKFSSEGLPKILANIMAVWSLKKSNVDFSKMSSGGTLLQPHPVQVLTLFRLLEQSDPQKFISQLVQVLTGEGKSVILGALSTIFALLGYEVSCVCYSKYLSKRDYDYFFPVFEVYGLVELIQYSTIAEMCDQIVNSDGNVREITKSFLNATFTGTKAKPRQSRKNRKRILLVDEVDVFFGLEFYGNTYNPASLFSNPDVYEILRFVWQNRANVSFSQVMKTGAMKSLTSKFPAWALLFESEVRKMLFDLRHMEDYHPIPYQDRICYKVHDEISFNTVHRYCTVFSYFQFFESGDISQDSLERNAGIYIGCGKFSYAEIPHMFDIIMGVSGTLESLTDIEKQIILQYGIKRVACAPSIYGASRREFRPRDDVRVFETKNEWFVKIIQHTQDKINANRAVIIFFEDIKILHEFHSRCITSFGKVQLLTEQSEHKDEIVVKATLSGMVTLCTRIFGRGVDFICRDDNTRSAGGVHVIQTFLSNSEAEFTQIKGRTARQGDPGTFELILHEADLLIGISKQDLAHATANATLFNVLNSAKDAHYNSEVKTLIEKAESVKPIHELTLKYYSALASFNGSDGEMKDIQGLILRLNAQTSDPFRYHLYFCLDDSHSMQGSPWTSLVTAVKGFVKKRIAMCQAAYSTPEDLVTIINHSSTSQIMCSNIPITENPASYCQFRGGGNSFRIAFNTAYTEIQKVRAGYTPVLLFMTDGGCAGGEAEIQQIATDFSALNIQIFVIGFGEGCDVKKLKNLSAISGGTYFFGYSGAQLISNFEQISTQLSTTTYAL